MDEASQLHRIATQLFRSHRKGTKDFLEGVCTDLCCLTNDLRINTVRLVFYLFIEIPKTRTEDRDTLWSLFFFLFFLFGEGRTSMVDQKAT